MHFWWRIASLMLMMLMMMMVMTRKISLSGTYVQKKQPKIPGGACPPGTQDIITESECREAGQWFARTYGGQQRFNDRKRCPVPGNCHCLVDQERRRRGRRPGRRRRRQMVNTDTVFSTIPPPFLHPFSSIASNYFRVCRQC